MKRCLACGERSEAESWTCPACGKTPENLMGFPSFAPELAGANEHYDPAFFAALSMKEAGHFWFEARNEMILWALRRFFPAMRSFMEIGCGTGFVLSAVERAFPEVRIFGSDIYSEGLAFASKRVQRATLLQMDAFRMPFEEEFDVLGAFDVLEHQERDDAFLDAMRGAVRPGGGILMTVPQHRFLWSDSDRLARHYRRYQKSEMLTKLKRAGFHPLLVSSFISILLPLMLVSRHTRRVKKGQTNDVVEMTIHPVLNAIFRRVMAVECALIRAGVRFPMGGSLLIAAKKVQ